MALGAREEGGESPQMEQNGIANGGDSIGEGGVIAPPAWVRFGLPQVP